MAGISLTCSIPAGGGYALLPEGMLLADGIHALADGRLARSLALEGVVAAASGQMAATLFRESILLWDLAASGQCAQLSGSLNPPVQAAFAPAGDRLVSAGDRFARVWDVASGQCTLKLKKHDAQTVKALWSPDGRRIVSVGQGDFAVRLWDAADGACTQVLNMPAHEGNAPWMDAPADVAWSAEGASVLTAANFLGIWDAESGELLAEWEAGGGFYSALAAMPDGRSGVAAVFFMAGEQVSRVVLRLVDLASGEVLAETDVAAAAGLSVTPDGSHVVARGLETIDIYAAG